jgi:hypothetical protein
VSRLTLATDKLPDMLELLGHALVIGNYFVERVRDLSKKADLVAGHSDRKITGLYRLKSMQQLVQLGAVAIELRGFTVVEFRRGVGYSNLG